MSRLAQLPFAPLALFLSVGCVVTPGSIDPWPNVPTIEAEPIEDDRPAIELVLASGDGDEQIPADLFSDSVLGEVGTSAERMKSAVEMAMEESGAFRVTSGLGTFRENTPQFSFLFRVVEITEETQADLAWYDVMRYWVFMIPLVSRVRVAGEIQDHDGTRVGDVIEAKGEAPIARDKKKSLVMSNAYGMRDAFDKGRDIALAEATQKCISRMIRAAANRTRPDVYDAEILD